MLRQNKWRAARYGLDAELIVDDRRRLHPCAESVEDLLDRARAGRPPSSVAADELAGSSDILDGGASYARQRRRGRRTGATSSTSSTSWSASCATDAGAPA